jgi:hypothetical protein
LGGPVPSQFESSGKVRACGSVCLIALSGWLFSPVVHAVMQRDNFARALQFLNAAYPELRGRHLGVALSNNYWRDFDAPLHPLRSFALLVKPSNDSQTPPAEDNLLLTAHFEFANDDYIDEFSAGSSRMLHAEELSKMSTLVLDHPAMTREGVGAALSAAGAKVGPGQDKELRVLADATFARLTFVTGVSKVIAVNWLQLDGTWWSVDLQARQSSTVRRYSALFEPFEGKLVHLKRGNIQRQ